MSSKNIIQPKQQRSKDTQTKLLAALHACLQDKFFEQITIKELAEEAGVSVGTFYRRFKDKESLLPLLYQEFGQDLQAWVDSLEHNNFCSLTDALERVCRDTFLFLQSKKAVFRTLHLNSRLQSNLIASDKRVDRRKIYLQISDIFLRFKGEVRGENAGEIADMAVFIIITTLLEKVLYPELTPAIASDDSAEALAEQLPKILLPYFISPA